MLANMPKELAPTPWWAYFYWGGLVGAFYISLVVLPIALIIFLVKKSKKALVWAGVSGGIILMSFLADKL